METRYSERFLHSKIKKYSMDEQAKFKAYFYILIYNDTLNVPLLYGFRYMSKILATLCASIFIITQNISPQLLVETMPLHGLTDVHLYPRCMRIMQDDILNIVARGRAMVQINQCSQTAKVLYRDDYPWIENKYRHCVVVVKNTQYPAYQLRSSKGIIICDIFTKGYVSKMIRGLEQREFYNTFGHSVRPQIEFRGYEKGFELALQYNESEYVFLQGGERSCFYLLHEIYKLRVPKCCGFRVNMFFDENSHPLIAVFTRNMLFESEICSPIVEFKSYAGATKYFCGFLTLSEGWYSKSSFQCRSSREGEKCMFMFRTTCGLRDRWDIRLAPEKPRSEVSESDTIGF